MLRRGVDLAGHDLAGGAVDARLAEDCRRHCDLRVGCNAYTWLFGVCYLKSVLASGDGSRGPGRVARSAVSYGPAWAVGGARERPVDRRVAVEQYKGEYSVTSRHLNIRYAREIGQRERVATVLATLRSFAAYLDRHGVQYWLTAGTLLGQNRDGRIIPWDDDADLGFTRGGVEALRRVAAATPPPCDDCELVFRAGEHSDVIPLQFVNTTNGVYVDSRLYNPGARPGELVFRWPYGAGPVAFRESDIFPLGRCELEGDAYPCPRRVEPYLRAFYPTLAMPAGRRGYVMPD